MTLIQRSTEPELMDTEPVSFAEFDDCLRQLRIINILTLAYRPTLRWFSQLYKTGQLASGQTVVDVGSGHGDMLRCVDQWARAKSLDLKLIGVDLNPQSRQSAEALSKGRENIEHRTANVFEFDPHERVDFIISSLFTHHLSDEQLIDFIRWMDSRAASGWFINDLHRHSIAYYFIKFMTRLIPCNRFIRHDAPVSVARAFTRQELQKALQKAGIAPSRTQIIWHFPFRYGVACRRS